MADSVTKLRYSTLRNYLHGIATTQLELGHPNPLHQSPLVWRMFKAIKRLQGHHVVRKRLPITVSILSQINHLFDPKTISTSACAPPCGSAHVVFSGLASLS
jgi:hypothetical protein